MCMRRKVTHRHRHTLIQFRLCFVGGGGDCGRLLFVEHILVQHRVHQTDGQCTDDGALGGDTQLHQIHACAHIAAALVFVVANAEYRNESSDSYFFFVNARNETMENDYYYSLE